MADTRRSHGCPTIPTISVITAMIRRDRGSTHLKHESDWLVRRLDDGSTEWTSPTGRKYVKPPPEPDEPDPP